MKTNQSTTKLAIIAMATLLLGAVGCEYAKDPLPSISNPNLDKGGPTHIEGASPEKLSPEIEAYYKSLEKQISDLEAQRAAADAAQQQQIQIQINLLNQIIVALQNPVTPPPPPPPPPVCEDGQVWVPGQYKTQGGGDNIVHYWVEGHCEPIPTSDPTGPDTPTGGTKDTTAPTIASVFPEGEFSLEATPGTMGIIVTFMEKMDPSSITKSSLVFDSVIPSEKTPTTIDSVVDHLNANAIFIFKLSQPLVAGKKYTVTLKKDGIKDVPGNALSASKTWSFTTKAATAVEASDVQDVDPNSQPTSESTSSTASDDLLWTLESGGFFGVTPDNPSQKLDCEGKAITAVRGRVDSYVRALELTCKDLNDLKGEGSVVRNTHWDSSDLTIKSTNMDLPYVLTSFWYKTCGDSRIICEVDLGFRYFVQKDGILIGETEYQFHGTLGWGSGNPKAGANVWDCGKEGKVIKKITTRIEKDTSMNAGDDEAGWVLADDVSVECGSIVKANK